PRLVDPPIRTPRCSEDFMRWRSAPLSTLYQPSASESSLDSSSESHALVDLPPRKRFKDSCSSEASGEEHIKIGTAYAETVIDLGVSDRVRAPTEDGLGMGAEVATSDIREDEEEFKADASAGGTMEITVDLLATGGISEPTRGDAHDLKGTLYDISHYMSEVPLDRITEFETAQRQLEAGQLVAIGERAGLADRVRSLGRENLKVMAALVIPISLDSSEESVGSHVPRVILFGTIPTSILVIPVVPSKVPIAPTNPLVAPEVGAVSVISPTEVLDLVDYSSSSDFDPSEDSLPVASELPLVSPFLSILVRPGEAIPFGQPYRTHPNGPHKLLTVRKRVGLFPACLFSDSLSDLPSVHSSGCVASGQSHSGPLTRVASPRLVDPPIRTPRCSEDFMRWRSAPLSTLYQPSASES
nr:hypothetical protein [Tanacetum cinerariifolium]